MTKPPLPSDRAAVKQLLVSGHVTPATRAVLEHRLMPPEPAGQVFTPAERTRLRAVAARLVPHDPAEHDLVGAVEGRLARQEGKGWRYAELPPGAEAYRALLGSLSPAFEKLSATEQDGVLYTAQRAQPRAFEDLLAELVEAYASHPLTQWRWGVVPYADVPGWASPGLNAREAWEPPLPEPE
ncbi:gluconate 2-dehydrogenase subunit 3 family protein [Deinococcus sp. HMF7620]|uniref:Gluconate 2-dehydrogenase subunit 3 family protein n=1 Tax=Deinococcus arboris TaxID=2682977 RepID=A0A7C9HTH8_9DEIO|nr:gluconate 2-dehydrogenase subunit 3 family protein [Deinococcus arboris]MVN88553.1 gluconate 2-dehydrogenase subunit 3 family protein [Deinococcus arboris]